MKFDRMNGVSKVLKPSNSALRALPSFFFCFSICFAGSPSADAFWGKKKQIQVSSFDFPESSDAVCRVYFHFGEVAERLDSASNMKSEWVALDYKVVDMKEVPGPLFDDAPGGKVRFLDSDGFSLATDYFLNKDFDKADLYGTVWIEKKRAEKIAAADVVPLRPDEMDSLQREKEAKCLEKTAQEEAWRAAIGKLQASDSPGPSNISKEKKSEGVGFPSPPQVDNGAGVQVKEAAPARETSAQNLKSDKPVENPTLEKSEPPKSTSTTQPDSLPRQAETKAPTALNSAAKSDPVTPEDNKGPDGGTRKLEAAGGSQAAASGISAKSPQAADEKAKQAENKVTGEPARDKMPQSSADNKILMRGGVSNEDIAEEIAAADKKPPTQIQPSPSQLPEAEGPGKKNDEAKEDV